MYSGFRKEEEREDCGQRRRAEILGEEPRESVTQDGPG